MSEERFESLLTNAELSVLKERSRQKTEEGWSEGHDDEHDLGQLAFAAACYALSGAGVTGGHPAQIEFWPWEDDWWRPSTARRDLVKAAALLLAEIERLDRSLKS